MIRLFLIPFFILNILIAPLAQNGAILDSSSKNLSKALEAIKKERTDSFEIYFEAAKTSFIEQQKNQDFFNEGIDLAKKLYKLRLYEYGISVIKTIEEVCEDSIVEGDKYYTEINFQLARGYYYLRDVANCKQRINQNLDFLDSTSIYYANHQNILGLINNWEGNPLKALPHLQKVLSIRRNVYGANDNRVATILNNLGSVYDDLFLLNKAALSYENGLTIRETIYGKSDFRLIALLNNLAVLKEKKGSFHSAIALYSRAEEILESNEEESKDELIAIYTNLAGVLKNVGALDEAKLYSKKVESLLLNTDNDEKNVRLGDLFTNLANSQPRPVSSIQLQKTGIDHYQKALDNTHPKLIAAQNNLGFYHNQNGSFQQALDILTPLEATIQNDSSNQTQYANLCNDIADAYLGLNQIAKAKSYNQKALNIQQAYFGEDNFRLAYSYNKLAKIANTENQKEKALEYIEAALIANRAADMPFEGYSSYKYYLESLLLKGQLKGGKEALAIYSIADQALANIKNELSSVGDKINLSQFAYRISKQAIEAALSLENDPEALKKAFYFSEKSKANVLSQLLTLNQGKNFAGIPEDSIRLEESLLSDINYYKLKLAENPNEEQAALFQNELFTAQTTYRALTEDFEQRYPKYYTLKYKQDIPSIKTIQKQIDAQTAIISYFSTENTLYSFVITQKDFNIYQKPIGEDFLEMQIGLRKTIYYRLDEDYLDLAHQLHQKLFNFKLAKNIQRLVLVPDGNLSQIPFEALLEKESKMKKGINFSNLPYLINRFDISYAPSVKLYLDQASKPGQVYQNDLLAYAPVFDTPQNIEFFEQGSRAALSGNIEIIRSVSLDGKQVAALPATLNEIQDIARVFDQKGKQAKAFLYDKASENALKKETKQKHQFIHIATHGFVNVEQPDLSGLMFYPDTSSTEDHILYSGEIYNLNFDSDLVVLSACESGLGETIQGEGLLGLSRAFTYAGANNLLVSLWKVQDQATSNLMVDFYNKFWEQNASTYGNALRQAKVNLIKSNRFNHPYYWSAFILLGK